MSYAMKRVVPIVGMLLILGYAVIKVASSNTDETKHPLPPGLSDLAAAKLVEIKDAAGQVVLSGNFSAPVQKGRETEYTADLVATSVDADATGIAEIEISKRADGTAEQELEVTVERLAAQAAFKVFVDGAEIAPFTTSAAGDAEVEISNEE